MIVYADAHEWVFLEDVSGECTGGSGMSIFIF